MSFGVCVIRGTKKSNWTKHIGPKLTRTQSNWTKKVLHTRTESILCFYLKQLEHMLVLTLKIHFTVTFLTLNTYISCPS